MQITADVITVREATRGDDACCPICGERSGRVQSRYQRMAADRPVGGRQILLLLKIRRFFCRNADSLRRIFAERFPDLSEPYARRTTQRAVDSWLQRGSVSLYLL